MRVYHNFIFGTRIQINVSRYGSGSGQMIRIRPNPKHWILHYTFMFQNIVHLLLFNKLLFSEQRVDNPPPPRLQICHIFMFSVREALNCRRKKLLIFSKWFDPPSRPPPSWLKKSIWGLTGKLWGFIS